MRRLIKAEFLKLVTTRMTYGLLLGAAAAALVPVVVGILRSGQNGVPSLGTVSNLRRVITNSGGVGTIFAQILGITAVAGEFRHKTAGATFLATPRRSRVILAKAIAFPVFGLLIGAAAVAAGLAVSMFWLSMGEVDVGSIWNVPVAGVAAAWVLAAGLFCLLGVGLGALLRNQLAAIIVALAWPQVIENIIHDMTWIYRWVPGGANSALVRADIAGLLPAWAGGALLLAYGLVFALLGSLLVAGRDVT